MHDLASDTLGLFRAALAPLPDLPAGLAERAVAHWELVKRWNARTNLTAIDQDDVAATHHYRDSLEGLALLVDGPVVDFGSGAGFPGMILALVRPQWTFTLVEPRRKRASFLEAAAARLGMANVRVLNGRIEDAPDRLYRHAVTRATFSDVERFAAAGRWLQADGTLLAYRAAAESSAAHGEGGEGQGMALVGRHDYRVANEPRVIETWTFSTRAHK